MIIRDFYSTWGSVLRPTSPVGRSSQDLLGYVTVCAPCHYTVTTGTSSVYGVLSMEGGGSQFELVRTLSPNVWDGDMKLQQVHPNGTTKALLHSLTLCPLYTGKEFY